MPAVRHEARVFRVLVLALLSLLISCSNDDASSDAPSWPPPAPAEGLGLQYKVGPFEIPANSEIHKCVTTRIEDSILVNRIESFASEKSHHFSADVTIVAIPEGVFDCHDVFTNEVMANSMTVYSTDRATNRVDFPDGVAGKLPAKYAHLILSFHFVNPSAKAKTVEGYLNLWTTDPSNVHTLVNGIVGEARNFKLPARSHSSVTGTCTIDRAVDVVALTGHAHQELTSFELRLIRGGKRPEKPDYRTTEWSGPPLDVRAQDPVHLDAGDSIEWTCNYENPRDETITDGESTSQEMCMAIVVYMPDQGFLACRVTPEAPNGHAKQQTPASSIN
jgi:hypothetical protein